MSFYFYIILKLELTTLKSSVFRSSFLLIRHIYPQIFKVGVECTNPLLMGFKLLKGILLLPMCAAPNSSQLVQELKPRVLLTYSFRM